MEHEKRIRSPGGLALLERVRRICASLPEVIEAVDGFGHTSFRVGKKPFAILGEDEERVSLAIKADPITQEALVRRGPFYRTPYIGQHGWVSVRGDAHIDWDEIRELVADAYRRTAPKRLARLMERRAPTQPDAPPAGATVAQPDGVDGGTGAR